MFPVYSSPKDPDMRILSFSRRNLKQSRPLERGFGSRLCLGFAIYNSVNFLCNHCMRLCVQYSARLKRRGPCFFGQLSFVRKTLIHTRGSITWGVYRKVRGVANNRYETGMEDRRRGR